MYYWRIEFTSYHIHSTAATSFIWTDGAILRIIAHRSYLLIKLKEGGLDSNQRHRVSSDQNRIIAVRALKQSSFLLRALPAELPPYINGFKS